MLEKITKSKSKAIFCFPPYAPIYICRGNTNTVEAKYLALKAHEFLIPIKKFLVKMVKKKQLVISFQIPKKISCISWAAFLIGSLCFSIYCQQHEAFLLKFRGRELSVNLILWRQQWKGNKVFYSFAISPCLCQTQSLLEKHSTVTGGQLYLLCIWRKLLWMLF